MFYDNEKDIIKGDTDIQVPEDDTVVWNDVLDNSDDELVSISKNSPKVEDEFDIPGSVTGEVSDADLLNILKNEEKSSDIGVDSDTAQTTYESVDDDEFNLDKQLENINIDDNVVSQANDNFKIPPKKKEKGGNGLLIVLFALLFGVTLAGAAYYAYTMFMDRAEDVASGDLEKNKTVQDSMDDTTKEDIAQRAEGNADEAAQVPVVSEDEVGEIKPDETPKETKKEVINIVQTGRSDPFLPVQKYVKVKVQEPPATLVRYDKANIIKPPAKFGIEDEVTTKMLTISVSGIMYDDQKPSAIITFENNDYFVQKGDRLDDYRVVDIGKNFVTVAHGKNLYKANIGEEFKLTDIYGNAKYLTGNYNGGRQYYSVGENKNNTKSETNSGSGKDRYVSDKDVEIKAR